MENQHPDFVTNDKLAIPDEISDFGSLLRTFRLNHGYSIQTFSKMIGLPPKKIADIELCKSDLPAENILRTWLLKLGCGKQTHKILVLARQYRVKHWLTLVRGESANPDVLRLIDCYKAKKLSDYDRALLKLIARSE